MLPPETNALSRLFLEAFGSFWTEAYTGAREVGVLALSSAQSYDRTSTLVSRITPFLAAQNVEPFDRRDWYGLIFNADDLDQSIDYNEGRLHGDGAEYDQTTLSYFQYPIGPTINGIGQILNRIEEPTAWLFEGQDFTINSRLHQIRFAEDPVTDSRFIGSLREDEIRVWAYDTRFNQNYTYEYVGYMAGYKEKNNTPAYLEFAKSLVPLLVDGPTASRFDTALVAATGYPLATEAETVIDTTRDAGGLLVITDKNVYRLPEEAIIIVDIGEVLSRGDTLCSALQVHEFNRGLLPENCDFLTIGPELFGGRFSAGLTFRNEELPTEVTTDTKARLRFQVDGVSADVEEFWNLVQEAETRLGQTLLEYLLDRDDPPAGAAPSLINPALFMAENFLRWGGVRLYVQTGKNAASQARRVSKVVSLGSAAARFVVTLAAENLVDSAEGPSEGGIDGGACPVALEEEAPTPTHIILRPTAIEPC